MDWEKESASVYIHFKDIDPIGFIREMLGEDFVPTGEDDEDVVGTFTRTELETMLGALDYMALAMAADGFPTGLVDDLADKLSGMLEE